MRTFAHGILVYICLSFVESAGAQGALDLMTVLDRAQSYVASYEERMGTIIGEEDYDQREVWDTPRGGVLVGNKRRRMSSDFLLTRIDGEWYGVRNVLLVDRKPVTERHNLASVMSQSPNAIAGQLSEITKNNERYNLGDWVRTVNVPTFPLTILHPKNFHGFTFEKQAEQRIDDAMTWEIRFTEVRRPTMIHDLLGNDQPQRGRLWVDPNSGRVFKTETLVDTKTGTLRGKVTLVVTYKESPKLNMLVPVEMREQYESKRDHVECLATYSNFRRFETEVKLDIGPIEQ